MRISILERIDRLARELVPVAVADENVHAI
jgi:hypothetical protein